jgi:hypothetical protein
MIHDINYNPNKGRIRAFIRDCLVAAAFCASFYWLSIIAWAVWGV